MKKGYGLTQTCVHDLSFSFFSAIMAEDFGSVEEPAVAAAPEIQDIKLFGKWSTDDVQVSDISLTVSTVLVCFFHSHKFDVVGFKCQ